MAQISGFLLGVIATLVGSEVMKQIPLQSAITFAALGTVNSTLFDRCNAETFANIDVFGTKVLEVIATPVSNFSIMLMSQEYTNLNFCNVTVTYTHPGRGDRVNVFAALPLSNWNGRFQGRGGGGFVTGVEAAVLAPGTAQGFALASTDGGHGLYEQSAESWALNSPGNINWNLLEDYSYAALGDMARIGQQLTSQFFSFPPKHSYWTGCSTGGRQGLMFAQRYPDLYDGILALAPAIGLDQFVIAEYYPQHVMNRIGYYPLPCETDAMTNEAIKACDSMDGVEDGIISLPSLCEFDPDILVGEEFECDGKKMTFTREAAAIAKAVWKGPFNPADPKKWYWYGFNHDIPFHGVAGTACSNSSASSCVGSPFICAEEFIRLFLQKDFDYPTTKMTDDEYFSMFHKATLEFSSMLGTSDPDLSLFKAHGGKMITWHGLADELIHVNGSSDYYKRVMELDGDVADYYRYFEAPGVNHCFGGAGPRPDDGETLAALMAWVENGTVPETLTARSDVGGSTVRELCLYPKTLMYVGGEREKAESWSCR